MPSSRHAAKSRSAWTIGDGSSSGRAVRRLQLAWGGRSELATLRGQADELDCPDHTPPQVLTTGMMVGMVLFAVIWTGVILRYVLSPLPTGPSLISDIAPNALPGGIIGIVYFVGLNMAALAIIAGIVALGYGFYIRLTSQESV